MLARHLGHLPAVDVAAWRLLLTGHVAHARAFDLTALRALPTVTHTHPLLWPNHTPGVSPLFVGTWTGVPLAALLEAVQPTAAARTINVYALDGYATSFPLSALPTLFVVHTLNGAPLPVKRGFPARLLALGRCEHKLPGALARVELATEPVLGLWEQRGLSATGTAPHTASLDGWEGDAEAGVHLWGTAYTNGDPAAVALSVDGGPWVPVASERPTQPYAPVRWRARWPAPGPGLYRVTVRASDDNRQPHTAFHSVSVRVPAHA